MARTTFRLDPELLAEAKTLAARQHRTLNSVMEEALRRMVATTHDVQNRPRVELVTWTSEPMPGVDLSPQGIKAILDRQDVEHYVEVAADDAH